MKLAQFYLPRWSKAPETAPAAAAEPIQPARLPEFLCHQGINYKIVAMDEWLALNARANAPIVDQKPDNSGYIWIAVGCISLGAAWMISTATTIANRQPQIIEKPVVVKEEVLKNTNCLIFCGR